MLKVEMLGNFVTSLLKGERINHSSCKEGIMALKLQKFVLIWYKLMKFKFYRNKLKYV